MKEAPQLGEGRRWIKRIGNPFQSANPARQAWRKADGLLAETSLMPNYDVLCIGNAIVDIIAQYDEAFFEPNGIVAS
ncbi:hypothetical protein NKI82_28770 [Mesorhizobium sp. M0482]|uniref:hypothetical protein n=1 Tax=Mesorhizobium sp. M0482 TaxID=2956948 RepID=UPI003335D3E3